MTYSNFYQSYTCISELFFYCLYFPGRPVNIIKNFKFFWYTIMCLFSIALSSNLLIWSFLILLILPCVVRPTKARVRSESWGGRQDFYPTSAACSSVHQFSSISSFVK